MQTPAENVMKVLTGKITDTVPFTVYERKIPQCKTERELRNRGMCIVNRQYNPYITCMPNVKQESRTYMENGTSLVRTEYTTPYGTLHTIDEPKEFTTWHHKRLFTCKEDYRALLFMAQDTIIKPEYERLLTQEAYGGGDIIYRGSLGSEPLQQLVSSWMGVEKFSYEWMDNRDEILKLYEAIREKKREIYRVVAESPVRHVNYGGNVIASVIGLEDFRRYNVPNYEEACDVLHRCGKLVGVHFDDNCRLLKDAIAGTALDYIEAFTPAPDTDMTVAEARTAWPEKTLWINFPSSVHIAPLETVYNTARDLLKEAGNTGRFIMGITEDVPAWRWQKNYLAIMDAIDDHGGTGRLKN